MQAKATFPWTIASIAGEWWWVRRQPHPPYPVEWVKESTIPNTYVPTDRDFLEQQGNKF